MLASLLAAFLAGLVGSPHCMGMCGGLAVACGGARRGLAWHGGRLTTYAVLGAFAGAFGLVLPGPSWVASAVSAALLIWFAAALAGLVREPTLRIPGIARLTARAAADDGPGGRIALGLATGLLPCGLLYAALAVPVASGDPLTGALSMVAFGVGTAPALIALTLGARRLVLRSLNARRVLAAGVLVLGLWSLGMRQGLLPRPGRSPGHGGAHAAPTMTATPPSTPSSLAAARAGG
jgi:hypothetical protein